MALIYKNYKACNITGGALHLVPTCVLAEILSRLLTSLKSHYVRSTEVRRYLRSICPSIFYQ